MSFTKEVFEGIASSIETIQQETLDDNDLTELLELLNSLFNIKESFLTENLELEVFWNEIISDSLSILHAGISGNYRLAIAGLRNLLEISCSSFYFLDHEIELKLFVNENGKSDKYVSTLINEHLFFTTKYIRTFYPDILAIQMSDNSVSSYLSTTYQKLCDVVHGRYASLTRKDGLKMTYSKPLFEKFKASYKYTIGAIFCMYVLRFNDFGDPVISKIVKELKVLK